jgi:hypothetical protein
MSSFSNPGDAVRSDGSLKDASEMLWSYDADESIPFPSDNASGSHTTSRHAPATVVAAVRGTARVSRPSRRYLEEAGASESASSTPAHKSAGVKRKATSALVNQRATRKIVDVVSDDDIGGDGDGGSRTPSPLPTELASDDYEALKAMADADNEVCAPQPRHSYLPSHLNPRLQSPHPVRSVLPTYASYSTARRVTSTLSLGSL